MKKLSILLILFCAGIVSAQAPTKLLDVRNGNNIVDNGVAQPNATYIAYRDADGKTELIDALCDLGNYAALDPATRPSKQAFANREIQHWLRERVRQNRERRAQARVPPVDTSDLP